MYTGKFSKRCTVHRYSRCLAPYRGALKDGLRRQDSPISPTYTSVYKLIGLEKRYLILSSSVYNERLDKSYFICIYALFSDKTRNFVSTKRELSRMLYAFVRW